MIRMLLFIAALNVPITVTSDDVYFDSDISVQWSQTPSSGTHFSKLGIGGEVLTNSIFSRGSTVRTDHLRMEDGPPDVDITTGMNVTYAVKFSSGTASMWRIFFDFYTDGGTTFVRRQIIDVGAVAGIPDRWEIAARTITGLSLTQDETNDLSCRVISDITLGGAGDFVHLAWARHNYTYIAVVKYPLSPDRTIAVQEDDRVISVKAESRTISVKKQDRTIGVK